MPKNQDDGDSAPMGNGEALKYICSKLKEPTSNCVEILYLSGQEINDSGLSVIIEMLKVNVYIKQLDLSLFSILFVIKLTFLWPCLLK